MQMFPQSAIPCENFHPLSYPLFIQTIAIPHAAMLLIADDLKLSTLDEALDIMFASCEYGNIVHPGGDDDNELQDALHANHCAMQKEMGYTRQSPAGHVCIMQFFLTLYIVISQIRISRLSRMPHQVHPLTQHSLSSIVSMTR